jgi:polar amino acid transport system substrate-binding protein
MLPSSFWKKAVQKRGLQVGTFLGLGLLCFFLISPQIFAETQPANESPTPARVEATAPQRPLNFWPRLGDRGEPVQSLQADLSQLGYDLSSSTGLFDESTDRAVRQFQRSKGLVADGIVGPLTRAQLALAIGQPVSLANNLASTASEPALSPDIQRIVERGKLIVSVLSKDNPPFFMTNQQGELDGSDIKMAQVVAQNLGVELELLRTAETFDEVVDDVYAHRADLAISKISRTLKRAQKIRFSQPYINLRQGLLVNRLQLAATSNGNNTTEMVRNLEGRIGVIEGSSYAGFVEQKFPKATAVEYASWPDVVKAVTEGDVLAAYRDELEVKKILLSKPNAALQFQTIALTDTQDPIAVVAPWQSDHLIAFVNQYLESVEQYTTDGLLDEYADYFQPS